MASGKWKIALALVFGVTVLSAAYLYYSSKTNNSAVSVYAVFDQSKVGEANMISAISQALPKVCGTWSLVTMTPQHIENGLTHDKAGTRVIITAGQFGINFLRSLAPLKEVKILLCTHQWFDDMKNLHDIFIAIPEHAINDDIQKIAQHQNLTLIPTQGVLHTMSAQILAKQDTSVIHLTDAKVGLILGGDAEMSNGKDWQLFSIENARKLAKEIAAFIKKTGYKILITNGPRTGSFINLTIKDSSAHRGGELDKVSSAFLDELHHAGLQKGQHFEFFDFQFGQPSALKAIMAVVLKNKGFMVVPGESTSSISEIMAVIPAVIYENDALNPMHKVFVDKVIQNNMAILWPNLPDQNLMEAYVPPHSQAISVIKKLLK